MIDKTGLELGATINLGNYNSIRATVWADVSKSIDIAVDQEILYQRLIEQLNDKLGRLLTDLHEKGWVVRD